MTKRSPIKPRVERTSTTCDEWSGGLHSVGLEPMHMGRVLKFGGLPALVALLGASAAVTRPVAQLARRQATLAFQGVTVVDVETGRRIPGQTVVVAGRRIQAVGPAGSTTIPTRARVVNGRSKYLIPGLWDMHVHPQSFQAIMYPLFIANGVTGIRDAGSWVPLATAREWKRAIAAGEQVGPRQVTSGPFVEDSGHRYGGWPTIQYVVLGVTATDAPRVVDSLWRAGADLVKTHGLAPEAYYAVLAAARRVGIPAGGHVPGGVSAADASDSGATILDHLNSAGGLDTLCWSPAATVERCRAVAERFVRNGTWFVPTIAVMTLGDPGRRSWPVVAQLLRRAREFGEFWPDSVLQVSLGGSYQRLVTDSVSFDSTWVTPSSLRSVDDSLGLMRFVERVGIPVLAGTDAMFILPQLPPGVSLHTELAALVAEGLTPLHALQAATLNPAKYLRGTDSLGTVAVGKLADLVLLDADPLADIRNTMQIRAVVANGHYFDRAALDGLLADAKRAAHR